MCDFSLQSVRSRPAKVGDKLVTRDFGTGTRGFAAADDLGLAVCVMPGTELAFAGEVTCLPTGLLRWETNTINHQTAIFRTSYKKQDGRTSRCARISGWAGRVADAPVRGSGGNSASTACAASNRNRGGCPEARHLRGLTVEDKTCVGRLRKRPETSSQSITCSEISISQSGRALDFTTRKVHRTDANYYRRPVGAPSVLRRFSSWPRINRVSISV